jgi:23S rRNA pseudouridine1911/1915/1917 synthase
MAIWESIYEDDRVIVVNKLAALSVLPDREGEACLREEVRRGLYGASGGFLEAPHRIDRPVTGAVAFAKDQAALAFLCEAFAKRRARKTYVAAVEAAPSVEEGILEHYLGWNAKNRKAFCVSVQEFRGGSLKKARLSYRLMGSTDRYWLLEIELETGRRHQIRVQLAAAGMRVKGDLKYGARRSNPTGLICLHARSLELPLPDGGVARAIAPYPEGEALWPRD